MAEALKRIVKDKKNLEPRPSGDGKIMPTRVAVDSQDKRRER
jgi:hypothetical protein